MCSETAVRMRRSVGTAFERDHRRVFAQLNPVKWAWLDLNQQAHPYQRWTAERCAIQRLRWSCDSVSPTGMG
jgi:hypothetical protein